MHSKYSKFIPLVYAAAAREALTKAELGPSFGSPPAYVFERTCEAATEVLRGFVTIVSPGADVSKILWSDYPTSHFELIKSKIATEEFYDLFREVVASLKQCESGSINENSFLAISVTFAKVARLLAILIETTR